MGPLAAYDGKQSLRNAQAADGAKQPVASKNARFFPVPGGLLNGLRSVLLISVGIAPSRVFRPGYRRREETCFRCSSHCPRLPEKR
jgi:hypothetical protein